MNAYYLHIYTCMHYVKMHIVYIKLIHMNTLRLVELFKNMKPMIIQNHFLKKSHKEASLVTNGQMNTQGVSAD